MCGNPENWTGRGQRLSVEVVVTTNRTKLSINNLSNAAGARPMSFTRHRLRVIDKISKFFASVITGLFLAMTFIIFITVFNIGIALYIGECTGKTYLGFLLVAAFYAVAGIILFLGRRALIRSAITSILIKKITRYGHRKNK